MQSELPRHRLVSQMLSNAVVLGTVVCLLVGCSSGNVATGLTGEQSVGQWTASGAFDTQLVLEDDGTMSATGWPSLVGCDGRGVTDVEDLRQADLRDFSGMWESYGGTLSYQLTLSFDNQVCPEGGTMAYVWRNDDGSLVMCIKVSPDISSDTVRRDQIFVLSKTPGGRDSAGSCR